VAFAEHGKMDAVSRQTSGGTPALELSTRGKVRRRGKGKLRVLTREALDGRTRARRQFDEIAEAIAADLGGTDNMSTIERELVEAFAGAALNVRAVNARVLLGENVDLTEQSVAISTMVRVASRLGTRRRPRDVTPTLRQYLREPAEIVADPEDG
jgi:hypothetical protein